MRFDIGLLRGIAVALLIPFCAGQLSAQPDDYRPLSRFLALDGARPVEQLKLGRPLARTLLGDAVHVYSMSLKKGEFASIRLDQIDADLLLVVFSPAGKVIDIVDTNTIHETEVATLNVAETGTFKVQVAQFDWKKPSVQYRLQLARREPLAATPDAKADQLISSWYDRDHPGMAISIMEAGKPVYQKAIGLAQVENHAPISFSTKFELASVSKQFTGIAIAKLMEEGRLSVDDDIRKWLPEIPDFGAKITVGHLLGHSSGIRDWDAAFGLAGLKIEDGITEQLVLQFASKQKSLNFGPGEQLLYSNTGYVLLGEIIGRVTGEPAAQWMQKNLFAPLGMNDTFLNSDYHAAIGGKAYSYEGRSPATALLSANSSAVGGSASVLSSVSDLEKWVANLEKLGQSDAKLAELLATTGRLNDGSPTEYAFGNWHGKRNGLNSISHLGLAAGFRTGIIRFPDQKMSMIFLSNDGDDATYARANKLAALFAPLTFPALEVPADELPASPAITHPELKANDFVGSYYSDELGQVYQIVAGKEGLVAVHMLNGEIAMIWSGDDGFSTDRFYMPSVQFRRNSAGIVEAMIVSTEGSRNMEFRKIM